MKLVCIIISLLASTITFSQNTIEGTWQPEGKDAIFKIFEENGKYYGQLIGSNDSNQDEQIKEKDAIILLRDLQKESNTNFCCGTFYRLIFGQF